VAGASEPRKEEPTIRQEMNRAMLTDYVYRGHRRPGLAGEHALGGGGGGGGWARPTEQRPPVAAETTGGLLAARKATGRQELSGAATLGPRVGPRSAVRMAD
jgi:hypothetical protein